jgi:homeobox protein cut-like
MNGLAKECRRTVKSYQEEIDSLTKRAKASETAFSSIHQGLSEVPDPSSLLATAVEQIQSQKTQMTQLLRTVDEVNREMASMETNFADKENRYQKEISQLKASKSEQASSGGMSKAEREELVQLRREVAEYEVEFRSLKNQDITIRKLEAKIQELQTVGEEEMKNQLEKAQQDLAETEGRRAAEALEREAAMERRVQSLELELKAERAGREATQAHLLEADEGAGEREAAWEAQRRILVDDAERLRVTLHEATRERDELRLRVAAVTGDSTGADRVGPTPPPSGSVSMSDMLLERKAYEAEVSELSHTANSLREELRLKEEAAADERRSSQMTIDSLESERSLLASRVASLEADLAAAPSQSLVESMRHELRILKRLEYNAHDVDAERDPEMTGGVQEDEMKDLESVLVAKLRRVESELVRERNQRTDLSSSCDQLKRDLQECEAAKAECETLIATLEADLEKAIASPATPKLARATSAPIEMADEDPSALQHILDPDAPPAPPVSSPANPQLKTIAAATEKAEDDHSVATIVMAQRDRLRARCEALEAERDSFKRELQVQVQASESLKSDNTKLYEKVRYLQNFNSSGAGSRNYSRTSSASDRDLDLEALEQRYEASVDPFRQFSRTERQRKLQEMSPMERAVFVVAKAMLGTKEMRTALFFYILAMHLLVFITTYHWSHELGCEDLHSPEHLSHLPPVMRNGQAASHAHEALADAGHT